MSDAAIVMRDRESDEGQREKRKNNTKSSMCTERGRRWMRGGRALGGEIDNICFVGTQQQACTQGATAATHSSSTLQRAAEPQQSAEEQSRARNRE